jgi:hypothetical protein
LPPCLASASCGSARPTGSIPPQTQGTQERPRRRPRAERGRPGRCRCPVGGCFLGGGGEEGRGGGGGGVGRGQATARAAISSCVAARRHKSTLHGFPPS